MHQTLAKPRVRQTGLIQDIFLEEKPRLSSNASLATCYVCENGLNDGHSLSAKIIDGETVLLCNTHNSKNY